MTARLLRYVLLAPAAWLVYAIAGLVPRDAGLYAFGAPKDRFGDNSKYLYLDAVRRGLRAVWISGDPRLVARLRADGLPAERRRSLRGLWSALRAGTHVVSCYSNDVNHWASRGARLVNLWHGVPLKRIERAVRTGPVADRHHGSWLRRLPYRLFAPHVYRVPDVLLVPSPHFATIFADAFGAPAEALYVAGYPRNGPLCDRAHPERVHRAELPPATCRALFGTDSVDERETLILYAPTFRDGGRPFAESCPLDWRRLDARLAAAGARMTVRLHPAARLGRWPDGLQRVRIEHGVDDIYPYLPLYDRLVTDYSSIYFDFLHLDRPITFFAFDLEDYRSDIRGMYFEYEAVTPGRVTRTEDELLAALFEPDLAADARRARIVADFELVQPPLTAAALESRLRTLTGAAAVAEAT